MGEKKQEKVAEQHFRIDADLKLVSEDSNKSQSVI